MASNWQYATKTDIENLLLVDIDSSFNAQMDTWISTAEERVNEYLGYTTASGIWQESITEEVSEARVDGNMNLVIHPKKNPISSISGIDIVKGAKRFTLTLTRPNGEARYTIPTGDKMIVFPSSEITGTGEFYIIRFSQIKYARFFTDIDYIAGYTSIPRPITLATSYLVADILMRQANKEGLSSITQGRVTKRWREYGDGKSVYTINAEELLNHYRITSGWV